MIPITAKIEEFYRGTWVADLATTELPTGAFEVGGTTWRGAVVPETPVQDGGRQRCRIVGGKGKLGVRLPEKNYGSVSLAIVARDILSECGEVAGSIVATARVDYYERARGTAGQALTELCANSGLNWWVSRDGVVNVGLERPTTATVDATRNPQLGADVDGSMVLNVESVADVHPGMQLSNGTVIRHVRWQFDSKLTADCSPTQPFPERSNDFYLKTFSAKVDAQNGNGSVNVIVDSRFKMNNVRLFAGNPGARVAVNPGETVLVGFLGANKSAPYAFGFEQNREAGNAQALVEDAIEVVLPPFALVGTFNGLPITGVMTAVIPKTLGKIVGPGSVRVKSK